jgi:excisionase family DNA binding protein
MPAKRKEKTTVEDVTKSPVGTIYTTREAARMLRLSQKTILRAIEKGQIKAKKAGKAWLIPEEQVKAYYDRLPSNVTN